MYAMYAIFFAMYALYAIYAIYAIYTMYAIYAIHAIHAICAIYMYTMYVLYEIYATCATHAMYAMYATSRLGREALFISGFKGLGWVRGSLSGLSVSGLKCRHGTMRGLLDETLCCRECVSLLATRLFLRLMRALEGLFWERGVHISTVKHTRSHTRAKVHVRAFGESATH